MTSTHAAPDRLYDLVPAVYRMRDADQGYPLRALLRVIAEQVTLVEQDIGAMQAAVGAHLELVVVKIDLRPERLQGQHVGVDAPPADAISATAFSSDASDREMSPENISTSPASTTRRSRRPSTRMASDGRDPSCAR